VFIFITAITGHRTIKSPMLSKSSPRVGNHSLEPTHTTILASFEDWKKKGEVKENGTDVLWEEELQAPVDLV
jgi:hypothetical protein